MGDNSLILAPFGEGAADGSAITDYRQVSLVAGGGLEFDHRRLDDNRS